MILFVVSQSCCHHKFVANICRRRVYSGTEGDIWTCSSNKCLFYTTSEGFLQCLFTRIAHFYDTTNLINVILHQSIWVLEEPVGSRCYIMLSYVLLFILRSFTAVCIYFCTLRAVKISNKVHCVQYEWVTDKKIWLNIWFFHYKQKYRFWVDLRTLEH